MRRESLRNGTTYSVESGRYLISGPMTFDTVTELLAVPDAWNGEQSPIVVDLAAVSRADSAGLALMIEWQKRARELRRALKFVNIPQRLQDLIRVVGLKPLFPNGNNGNSNG